MSGIIGGAGSRSGVIGVGTGLEFILRTEWSSGNNMLASNCFSDKFEQYLVNIHASPNNDTHTIKLRLNDGGTDNESSAYWNTFNGLNWDGGTYNFSGVASAFNYLSPNVNNSTSYSLDASIWINNARSTTKNINMNGTLSWLHGSGYGIGGHWAAGHTSSGIAWEGLRVYTSNSLTSGNHIEVYGVKT